MAGGAPKKKSKRKVKSGSSYEQFVYRKLRRLYVEGDVRVNDKILGKQSGLQREIDVSVRHTLDSQEVLFVVQCKDRAKRPADIVILGEFASVIQDVGAAKGFLVCTSGFAKSNHQYAKTMGIELVTFEDVESERWNVAIEIPVVFIRKDVHYKYSLAVTINEALAQANRGQDLVVTVNHETLVSNDGGLTTQTVAARLESLAVPSERPVDVHIDISEPGLQILIVGIWVDIDEFEVVYSVRPRHLLRYVTPTEYSQLRDHVTGAVLPLHMCVELLQVDLDDRYVELDESIVPAFEGLWIELEQTSAFELLNEGN